MVDAVILAAGASTRSGPTVKALLQPVPGTTVLRHVVELAKSAGVARVFVVLGAHAQEVRAVLEGLGTIPVVHPTWAQGRTGSVKAGLRAVDRSDGPTLLWAVDHPFLRPTTLAALLGPPPSDLSPGISWTVPVFRGRRGHPVVLGARARGEVLTYADDEPLFRYPRGHPEEVREVTVEDPGVLENIDTPEAWAAARARWASETASAQSARS